MAKLIKQKKDDAGADKKTTTVIVGDSMVKYLNANRLKKVNIKIAKACKQYN